MSNQLAPVQQLLASRKGELAKMLPENIKIDSFERAINNALMRNQDLLNCDQLSVYDAAMRCAQDGLIPDGKEAAIVVYGGKQGKKAQYQPMIDGVLKRVRQSGIVTNISGKAVYENDEFDYWMDEDGEHIKYRPTWGDKGKFQLAFAYAKTNDGELIVEVMNLTEINKVKAASKTGNSQYGPWSQWYDRMAVKSVLHRLARRLPSSSEVQTMIDTIEKDIEARFDEAKDVTPKQGGLADLANQSVNTETGEISQAAQEFFNEESK
tara:strand:+ start:19887 stop:20684 length:798 start_codon:yes stop_codon:yes gene_type:complete